MIPDLDPGQAAMVDWSDRDYFADTEAVSRSDLVLLRRDPGAYRAKVAGELPPSSPSRSMDFGTWTHLALLEPEEWTRRVGMPVPSRPDNADGNAPHGSPGRMAFDRWREVMDRWRSLHAQIPDGIEVSLEDFQRVLAIVEAVGEHPEARALIGSPGVNERTVLWREPTSGVLVKVKPDRIVEIDYATAAGLEGVSPGVAIPDLKTTKDHERKAFARSARGYGYREQAALYLDAVQALRPDRPARFYFVAVRSTLPRVAVYAPDDATIAAGRESYRSLLAELIERRESDNWAAEYECGVSPITI